MNIMDSCTLYRLESDSHIYYGISYAWKKHIIPLQLDYERYCKRGGINKSRYEILRQREYSMTTLGTYTRNEAYQELRTLIKRATESSKSGKICLNSSW